MIELSLTKPEKVKPDFLAAADDLLKNPTPEMQAFYDELRRKGGWGQDEGGLYYQHPDGKREYKTSERGKA